VIQKCIDWPSAEEKAERMTIAQLLHARRDCAISAAMWDPFDRKHGTNVGGYYRDEASVYVREMNRRSVH